eukprot:scaffold76032_cov33-Tisochrysis_lutea.AAC.3
MHSTHLLFPRRASARCLAHPHGVRSQGCGRLCARTDVILLQTREEACDSGGVDVIKYTLVGGSSS